MALYLSADEKIARLRQDLRMGAFVLIRDADGLWLAGASETLTEARFLHMQSVGTPELVLTDWRARALKTWGSDGDLARFKVPTDQSLAWIRSLADPSDDLSMPLKGPFNVVMDGSPAVHRVVLELCKQSYLLPSAIVVRIEDAQDSDFDEVSLSEIEQALAASSPLGLITAAHVPLAAARNAKVHVFRPDDGGEEHYAIEIGSPARNTPVLSRLHSACFTGDILGSLKCDCGVQLAAALASIGSEGHGVLLYLNQEGRGIGMANKMRAYSLQDQGFDTVEANHRLGFEDDERDFKLGADILKWLGFSSVRLMTNNPAKTAIMEKSGISVAERVPLQVGRNEVNDAYLKTKAEKSGHLL